MRRIAGIDEAGRGPVIGPMVIAGVVVKERRIPELIEIGVKDSKKLTAKKRQALLEPIMQIVEAHHTEVVAAEFIDFTRKSSNLNRIEATCMAKILDMLRPDLAQVGSADVLPSRFRNMILEEMRSPTEILSVHHAEDQFPAVAAASIIAKTTRDGLVESLHSHYGDFGSGYPSDPKTKAYIRKMLTKESLPCIVRKSWKTIENLAQGDLQ